MPQLTELLKKVRRSQKTGKRTAKNRKKYKMIAEITAKRDIENTKKTDGEVNFLES